MFLLGFFCHVSLYLGVMSKMSLMNLSIVDSRNTDFKYPKSPKPKNNMKAKPMKPRSTNTRETKLEASSSDSWSKSRISGLEEEERSKAELRGTPICRCELVCVRRTSKTKLNPGRRFFGCSLFKV